MTGPYGWNNPDPALREKADRVEGALDELEAALVDMLSTPGSLGFDSRNRTDTYSSARTSLRRAHAILSRYIDRVRSHPWP
jgi:hypothetical protein